ncbi:MAG: hypothetical protein NTZ56_05980 [Acidobacteria bacterium]|nr:hypothetical protein [Acidobacteriota bacterium]
MFGGTRLGDDIDDFCIKCKRLSNHAIVALIEDRPAKVRCRSCYFDHDFLFGIAPPKKETVKKPKPPAVAAAPAEPVAPANGAAPSDLGIDHATPDGTAANMESSAPSPD